MTTFITTESVGTLIEAVATQDCLTVVDKPEYRVGAATRYGVIYTSPADGTETLVNRLFASAEDAAVEKADYLIARVVKIFVEVADV